MYRSFSGDDIMLCLLQVGEVRVGGGGADTTPLVMNMQTLHQLHSRLIA